MKIPDSAMNSMIEMVKRSLPYETSFAWKTAQAKRLVLIFEAIAIHDEQFADLDGFVNKIAKSIDDNSIKQESIQRLYDELSSILNRDL